MRTQELKCIDITRCKESLDTANGVIMLAELRHGIIMPPDIPIDDITVHSHLLLNL